MRRNITTMGAAVVIKVFWRLGFDSLVIAVLAIGSVVGLIAASSFQVTAAAAAKPSDDHGRSKLYKRIAATQYESDTVLVRLKPDRDKKLLQPTLGKLKATKIEPLVKPSKYSDKNAAIFRWYRVVVPQDAGATLSFLKQKGSNKTKQRITMNDTAAFGKLEAITEELKSNKSVVEAASLSVIMDTDQTPNDPYFQSNNTVNEGDLYGLKHINAEAAWDKTTGSPSVTIADIDTGVDRNHPDLVANTWVNTHETPNNGIDDDSNGYVDDYYGWDFANNDSDPMDDRGHGTHTAGTAAAVSNNGLGVSGVSWQSKIMAVKFLSSDGSGSDIDAAKALVYAADNGAQVSSNSWGSDSDSQLVHDAVRYEYDRGISVIVAAGNDATDSQGHYPANYSEAISVGATDEHNQRADFSNYGMHVNVFAPGVNILSLKASQSPMCTSQKTIDTNYCVASGTSMATPHVAGAVALLLARTPGLSPEQIRQSLMTSTTDLGAPGHDAIFGAGLLDVNRALDAAQTRPLAPKITSPTPLDTTAIGKVDVFGSITGNNFASYRLEIGAGTAPTNWTVLKQSTTQIQNEQLGWYNIEDYPGVRSLRLVATNAVGYESYFIVSGLSDDRSEPQVGFADLRDADRSTAQTVSGTYRIAPPVMDNKAVKRVLFYTTIAGNYGFYLTDPVIDTTPPFERQWDTTAEANGALGQFVVAEDAAGNIGKQVMYFTVANADQLAPSVQLDSNLHDGQVVQGSLPFTIDASDDKALKKIEIFTDGSLETVFDDLFDLEPTTSGIRSHSAYPTYWDSKKWGDGSHTIRVKVTDMAGKTDSTDITLVANNSSAADTTAPAAPSEVHINSNDNSTQGPYIGFDWNNPTEPDVAGYRLYRDGQKRADIPYTYGAWLRQSVGDKVTAGQTYHYDLYAVDTAGNLSPATSLDVTASSRVLQLPTVPTNLSATLPNPYDIHLTWNPSTDDRAVRWYPFFENNYAHGYSYQTSTDAYMGSNASGKTFSYNVVAIDDDNQSSAASLPAFVTIPADTQPPTKPNGLETQEKFNRLDVLWYGSSDNFNVDYYRLLRDGQEIARVPGYQYIPGVYKSLYRDNDVLARHSYHYQVIAVDSSGNASPASDTLTAVYQPDNQPPTAPTNLVKTSLGEHDVSLSWGAATDNDGVSGYEVWRNGQKLGQAILGTTFTDSNLNAGTTYTYKVRALDSSNNTSGFSNTLLVTTLEFDHQPPTAPGSVTATATSYSQVTVNWTASTDNKGVAFYRITRDGQVVAETSALSYADTSLQASTTYRYRVIAVDTSGNISTPSNEAVVTTPSVAPDTTPPTIPANVQVAQVTSTQISLIWNASSDNRGVSRYEIVRGGTQIASVTGTSFGDSGLTINTTYKYQIRAVDAAGNKSALSPAVSIKPLDIDPPTTPTNLISTSKTNVKISLQWDAASDNVRISSYDIYRNGAKITSTSQLTYNSTGLTPNTAYIYYIVAKDSAGNYSGNSNQLTVTTYTTCTSGVCH